MFNVYDLCTDWLASYRCGSRSSDEVSEHLAHFKGEDKIKYCHSDAAPNIVKGVQVTGGHNVCCRTSTPGNPSQNGLIESKNKLTMRRVRSALNQAGLPPCFWPYAADYVCMIHNIKPGDDGERP